MAAERVPTPLKFSYKPFIVSMPYHPNAQIYNPRLLSHPLRIILGKHIHVYTRTYT